METPESRIMLKKYPATEALVRQILGAMAIDYDDETVYSWEIRVLSRPDREVQSGTGTVAKLWVNNEFVVNVSPITEELRDWIDITYPLPRQEAEHLPDPQSPEHLPLNG